METTGQISHFVRRALVEQLYRGLGDSSYTAGSLRRLRVDLVRLTWALTVTSTASLKRGMDVAVSLIALIGLGPLFCLVALVIHFEDGGPILFWQSRVGLHGREFRFPKFRSMVVNAENLKRTLLDKNQHGFGITFKMKRDPRVTRVGSIIRKLSIDELPQLLCVLHGDMSLVGPRPAVPNEVARYALRDRRRLDVKPGLTCIWQVSGRSELAFDQQVLLDEKYIDSHNLLLDLALLFKTIPAILGGRGAY